MAQNPMKTMSPSNKEELEKQTPKTPAATATPTTVLPASTYVPPARIESTGGMPSKTYAGFENAGSTPVDVTAGNLMEQSGNQIASQLSGNAYAPFAMQTQQALGRAEANQRARAASAIHSAGFSGTPLGAAAGNATEAELLRNRFDANLGIEAERQKSMSVGAANALQYGDAVNKWKADSADAEQQELSRARSNAAGFLMSFPTLQEAIRTGTPEEALAEIDRWLDENPRAKEALARYFGRDFTAADVYNFNRDMRYSSDMQYSLAVALAGVNGDPADWMETAQKIRTGEWIPILDKDGNLQFKNK